MEEGQERRKRNGERGPGGEEKEGRKAGRTRNVCAVVLLQLEPGPLLSSRSSALQIAGAHTIYIFIYIFIYIYILYIYIAGTEEGGRGGPG